MRRFFVSFLACLAVSLPSLAQEDEAGWLGLAFYNLSPELAIAMDAEGETGIVLVGVAERSSAAISGLQRNDIVTAIDNRDMADGDAVIEYAGGLSAGTTALVSVVRDGVQMTVPVMLVPRPADLQSVNILKAQDGLQSAGGSLGGGDFLGLALSPASSSQLDEAGLPAGSLGFVIDDVDILSLGGLSGLREGMIIVEIEQEPFRTFDLLEFFVREAVLTEKTYLNFGIFHEGEIRNIAIRTPIEYKVD